MFKKFKNSDIYYLYENTNHVTRNVNFNNTKNDKNVTWVRRRIKIYDYIIISNNNYKNILKDINNKLNILIFENSENNENNENISSSIDVIYNKELLSIEKYMHNEFAYCVFEKKSGINYFSKNIIIGNNSIKSNAIMKNLTKEEINKFDRLQQISDEAEYFLNQNNYKTIKYYVRSVSDNCYNNEYIFSNIPNGKSINNTLVLEKGNRYIFEMTSNTCPFHINASYLHNISFNINSNKFVYVNNPSILKDQTIDFFIPVNYNKHIYYFSYFNRKSKMEKFKLINKKGLKNMTLTYN